MINRAYLLPHPPLIIPQVGRGEEKKIQATIDAYKLAAREIAAFRPALIIVLSPHSVMYADYFHISPGASAFGSMARFRAPDIKLTVEYDTEFTARLENLARDAGFPAGTKGEREKELDHASFIPLFFIEEAYREARSTAQSPGIDYKAARLGVSGLSLQTHSEFGRLINQAAACAEGADGRAGGRGVVLIASGDLSHKLTEDGPYGFAPEGPAFDAKVCDIVRRGKLDEFLTLDEEFCDRAAECGLRPLAALAGVFEGRTICGDLYSYEGPFGVGYAAASFCVKEER
ncbi:MAG: hypothetical protein LBG72_05865 [Spirochaetaceae bacterium]|jgi:aromatic ring-opening dioxygenase LigB subunit|nr:hypothetical protein [Spirochaetaceae bacterium]